MKVLSLFDGMACGMIAMKSSGVDVESYDAYEIDKYAIKTAQHNFPMIKEHGDVFTADFSQYNGVDFLIGGSPCTYWSIARGDNREVKASGLGWELFSQYVRALHEAKPQYFIYENNKSMSKEIKDSIDKAFGFEAICINSALVSAQNRLRLYWVGKRNVDGTYSKVDVKQPEDRKILFKAVLNANSGKALTDGELAYMVRETRSGNNHFDYGYIQDGSKSKSQCLTANVSKGVPYNVLCEPVGETDDGKAYCLTSSYMAGVSPHDTLGKSRRSMVAEAVDGEFDDAKIYTVKNGKVIINGKEYSVRLVDGRYIFRKMTVDECKRLQTVPDWYKFPVSNTQAYKMLGNGWTCEVIAHLIKSAIK